MEETVGVAKGVVTVVEGRGEEMVVAGMAGEPVEETDNCP